MKPDAEVTRQCRLQRAYKAAGLCGCGRISAPGRSGCPRCLEESRRRYHADREAKNAASCARQSRHRAAGLCGCGRTPAPGRARCQRCIDYHTRYRAAAPATV